MRKLKNWYDGYMAYVEESEPPRAFCKWVCFGVIMSALRRKTWLQWENETYPNEFIVLVGPPGLRKGTAMDQGRLLLDAIDVKLAQDSSSTRRLVGDLDRATAVATIGDRAFPHNSLIIFNNELIVLVNKRNEDIIGVLNDLYDCRHRWSYGTEHAGSHALQNTWLHIVAATTPELLKQHITFDAVGAGFASRVVFVYGDKEYKTVALPHKVRPPEKLVEALIYDLREIAMMVGEFTITPEAEKFYVDWYNETKKHRFREDRILGYYINRRPKHLLKLGMALSAAAGDSKVIDLQHVFEASKHIEEVESLLPLVFAGVSKIPEAALADLIMYDLKKEKKVLYSVVFKRYYHTYKPEEIQKAVALLSSMNSCKVEFIKNSDDRLLSLPNKKLPPGKEVQTNPQYKLTQGGEEK